MFEYIKGEVTSIKSDYIVIENNGIGYKIYTSENSISEINLKESIKVYIYYNLREDGLSLYGFLSEEELDMFNMLITVSKVGPKTALGVLSSLSVDEIKLAIIDKNIKKLCEAPGIGKKTAERVILELRDKIGDLPVSTLNSSINNNQLNMAIEALETLGYLKSEINKALIDIDTHSMTEEDIIKEFLMNAGK